MSGEKQSGTFFEQLAAICSVKGTKAENDLFMELTTQLDRLKLKSENR